MEALGCEAPALTSTPVPSRGHPDPPWLAAIRSSRSPVLKVVAPAAELVPESALLLPEAAWANWEWSAVRSLSSPPAGADHQDSRITSVPYLRGAHRSGSARVTFSTATASDRLLA